MSNIITMKLKLFSFYSRILAACLVLLGFSVCVASCSKYGSPSVEYGVPSAKYNIQGKVVSAEGEKAPIKGIRVVKVPDIDEEYSYLRGDTTYTDSEGKFEFEWGASPFNEYEVRFQDIDGEENGLFEDKEQFIEFKNSDFKNGDGHWYRGEALKNMGNVELKPKK